MLLQMLKPQPDMINALNGISTRPDSEPRLLEHKCPPLAIAGLPEVSQRASHTCSRSSILLNIARSNNLRNMDITNYINAPQRRCLLIANLPIHVSMPHYTLHWLYQSTLSRSPYCSHTAPKFGAVQQFSECCQHSPNTSMAEMGVISR